LNVGLICEHPDEVGLDWFWKMDPCPALQYAACVRIGLQILTAQVRVSLYAKLQTHHFSFSGNW